MAKKAATKTTDLLDYQTEIEAELRREFTPKASSTPQGAQAAPWVDPAVLQAILQQLPIILAAIQRVLESRHGGSTS